MKISRNDLHVTAVGTTPRDLMNWIMFVLGQADDVDEFELLIHPVRNGDNG